jgi:hypothetical protein
MSSTYMLIILDEHNGDDSPQSYIHLRFLGIQHHLRYAPFIGLAALFVSAGI